MVAQVVVSHVVGHSLDELFSRIQNARLVFSNLKHLWRQCEFQLSIKGQIYTAVIKSFLLYVPETWSLRADDMRRLSVWTPLFS